MNEDTGDATNNNVFLITVGSPANDKPELKPTEGSMDVFSTGGYEDVPGIGITDSDLDAITTGEKDFLRVEVSVVDAGDNPVPGAKLTYTAADPASGDAHVSGKESNSLVVQGTRAEVQAILNSLRVDPGSDRDSATDKIRIVADDRLRDSSGNFLLVDGKQTANGGRENEAPYNAPDTDKEVNDANNRVTAYIALRSSTTNDAPGIANTTPFRVNEDVELALNGFTLSDADSFDKHVTVTVALFRDALRTQPADPATEGKPDRRRLRQVDPEFRRLLLLPAESRQPRGQRTGSWGPSPDRDILLHDQRRRRGRIHCQAGHHHQRQRRAQGRERFLLRQARRYGDQQSFGQRPAVSGRRQCLDPGLRPGSRLRDGQRRRDVLLHGLLWLFRGGLLHVHDHGRRRGHIHGHGVHRH